MRTNYQKPNTKIVLLQHQSHLLLGTGTYPVNTLNTNLGDDAIIYTQQGSTKNSRSRSFDDWDDEEDF